MKKRIPLLLLMLLGLVLTACGTKTVKPPELSGIEPVEIMVGDDFDPLDGVAATDEKDGNITSKIVVEGTVDVNKAGVCSGGYIVLKWSWTAIIKPAYPFSSPDE